jgi:hypothetical protein
VGPLIRFNPAAASRSNAVRLKSGFAARRRAHCACRKWAAKPLPFKDICSSRSRPSVASQRSHIWHSVPFCASRYQVE